MKRLSLFALALPSVISVCGQSIIPKFGGTLTSVDLLAKTNNNTGIIAGLAFEIPLNERFSIQPEILYHQKGYKYSGRIPVIDFDGSTHEVSYKSNYDWNYIELPVMVKVHVKKFNIGFGPYFAYGIGGKYRVALGNSPTVSGKVKFKESNGWTQLVNDTNFYVDNAFDWGISIGAGLMVLKRMSLDIRYGYGLANCFDKDPSVNFLDNKSKNRSFQFTVGYPIKL